jgi:O-succinylbenzoate synthase
MKLERIEVRHIRLPLKHPFETSFGRTTSKEFLLVSVSSGGVTGHGECVADTDPYYLPETNGTVIHILREFLAPLAFSLDIGDPRDVLPAVARVRGHEMAKACLEMAIWELAARRDGAPLHRLLGGSRERIESGVSIGLQKDEAALLERVETEVAAGYRRIKIKIKPGHDRRLAAAVRARFPQIRLMVDANSAYTLDDASVLRELDAFDLMMVEQPLAWDDIADHAALQKELRTPICLDESIRGVDNARHALDFGACRIINIKVGRVGGFRGMLDIHELCRGRGVPVWCGGMLESGIGRLANVHLQTLPGDTSASARYFEEDLVDPPVVVAADGTIAVPDAPGIGHDIVWSRVEKATTWKEVWKP